MVQRIQRDEINSLPDALTNDAFTLMFGSIPGESDTRRLMLQCQSAQEPEETNEAITTMLAGFQKRQSGTNTNQGTFQVTFLETVDLAVLSRIRTWKQYCRGTATGSSVGYSQDYTRTAELTVFDTTGAEAKKVTIYKCFPSNIDAISYDSSNSAAPVIVTVTFTYDYAIFGEATTL